MSIADLDLPTLVFLLAIVALLPVSLVVFLLTRSHQPSRITGPMRLEPPQSAWPVLWVFVAVAVVWVGAQGAYGVYLQIRHSEAGTLAPMSIEEFTPGDMAFLIAVPAVLGIGAFALAYALFFRAGPRLLGFSLKHIPRGLWLGLVSAVVVLPVVYASAFLTGIIYEWVGYEHPREHELLRALAESDSWMVRTVIILAATLIVPVFEELLFRGHLQTLVGRMLRRRPPLAQFAPFPAMPAEVGVAQLAPAHLAMAIEQLPQGSGPIPLSYQPLPLPDPVRSPWRTWIAVIIVSVLFALVHPLWTAPPIFVIAMGLGYVYERTGNLYACITMHALFNTISTIQSFYLPQ